MGKFNDLAGQKFGRLTVLELYGRDKYGKILYKCRCDCGNEHITHGRSLLNGHCQSCGCLNHDVKIENSKYGGLAQQEKRLYQIWKSMMARCNNPNHKNYKDYGGRGISVCKEWADPYCGFVSFVKWAKYHGYEEQLSIDRINNDKGYYPSNCRWVDWNVQANNRRKPTMITNQYGKWPYRDMPLPEPPEEGT